MTPQQQHVDLADAAPIPRLHGEVQVHLVAQERIHVDEELENSAATSGRSSSLLSAPRP